jgi:hypothetical protein
MITLKVCHSFVMMMAIPAISSKICYYDAIRIRFAKFATADGPDDVLLLQDSASTKTAACTLQHIW